LAKEIVSVESFLERFGPQLTQQRMSFWKILSPKEKPESAGIPQAEASTSPKH
jgi:hypothetical protein